MIFKTLNWLLDPSKGQLQVFRERDEELKKEGVEMRGDSKDGNPFPAKKLKPVNGGGGEG